MRMRDRGENEKVREREGERMRERKDNNKSLPTSILTSLEEED